MKMRIRLIVATASVLAHVTAATASAQSVGRGSVGPPVRQTAMLDSVNGSSTSGKATTVMAGDGRRLDIQFDINGPADTVEIVGPDGTATDSVGVSGPGRETVTIQAPAPVTLINTMRGGVTIRVTSAGSAVAEGAAEPGLHRMTRYALDDGGESRGECYVLTEGGAATSSIQTQQVIFDDFAFVQCEIDSPGWTDDGFFDGPPGAGGPILFDASPHAGQEFFMEIIDDPLPAIFAAAAPNNGHPFFNGTPFAFGGSDPCASDPDTLCVDLLSGIDIAPGDPTVPLGGRLALFAVGSYDDGSQYPFQISPWSTVDARSVIYNGDTLKPEGAVMLMNMCDEGGGILTSSIVPGPGISILWTPVAYNASGEEYFAEGPQSLPITIPCP